MKPRIRYSSTLDCWVVHYGPKTRATVHVTWPDALAWLGIPCPDGWA